ncbi:AAA family ATPase [Syntrophorhabdus aromaticivorans]|uniref:AAA family ATPase n=1 Tax=Syntrophorhabdus aromaticivorans TaxID=328301 RepID=A0A971M6R3_9BACT|nr:AAA family ATPase [Syntrophorhabdus aromaticivorans]NLW36487.1 AAA family ATPase [Syntrophorhabdus aromaticivorans]
MIMQTVKLSVKNGAARAELERLIPGTPGYVIETDDNAPCDLLFFEITDVNVEKQFDFARQALSSRMAGQIFLVSKVTDPAILIQALKVGAKEFFALPLKGEEVTNALLAFQAAKASVENRPAAEPAKEGTIIYVLGSKGGVGTTTIAVNLAVNLAGADSGKTASLIDMNLLFGEIPIFLGVKSPLFDWAEIARNVSRLDRTFLMGTLHKHPSGLYVLPSPASIFETISSGPDIITKLLRLMKTMFDYVVIDGGEDMGDMSKALLAISDMVLVVTLLNLPCLINVKRLLDTFERLGYPNDQKVSIVANRVHRKSGGVSIDEAEKAIKKPVFWTVPNDYTNTMEAINMGKTLHEIAPGSAIDKKISGLARTFYAEHFTEHSTERKKKGIFGVFS